MTALPRTPVLPEATLVGAASRPTATSNATIRNVPFTSIRDVALTASNAQEAVIPNLIFAESG
jgi:hypothetical protein